MTQDGKNRIVLGVLLSAIALIVVLAVSHSEKERTAAVATSEFVGKPMQIGTNSTPLCASRDKLDQFVGAITGGEQVSADSICYMGKPGTTIEVIEDLGPYKGADYGHALRVNVIGGDTTLPAYTLSEGLDPR